MDKTISMADFIESHKTKNLNIIDVREVSEYHSGHIPRSVNMPLSELDETYPGLSKDEEYLIVCRSGARSGRATDFLIGKGYRAKNIEGGMNQWSGEIDH